jgi:hypothetical protein
MQDFINKFWERTVAPSLRKIINENKDNSERIVSTLNEISNEDITSAQEDTTKAVEEVQSTIKGVQETIESISYEPIQKKLDTLIQTVQEKDLSVSVGETIIDTKGIIKSIQELKKTIPSLPKQIDYTNSFEKLLTAFAEYSYKDDEKESKSSHRTLVEQLLSRLATTQDIAILAEWLRVISEKEEIDYPFKFSDKGRLLIEVDRVGGGGGGGLVRSESEALVSIPEKLEDPLTPYKITDKDDDASPNYFGFTKKDGSWYIMKETVSAGADTYRYVAGTEDYTTNWTNRASLSYDYFYTTF